MNRSWKTSTFGLLAALGGAVLAGLESGMIDSSNLPSWLKGLAGLCLALGVGGTGWFARDDNKTSEQVGAAGPEARPGRLPLMGSALVLGGGLLVSACATERLAPGADPVVVYAERTAKVTLALADGFLSWELENRPGLPSQVTAAADTLRDDFPKAWWEFRKLTKVYKANRTPENRADLQTAQAVLERLVQTVRNYAPPQVQEKAARAAPKLVLP